MNIEMITILRWDMRCHISSSMFDNVNVTDFRMYIINEIRLNIENMLQHMLDSSYGTIEFERINNK